MGMTNLRWLSPSFLFVFIIFSTIFVVITIPYKGMVYYP